MDNAKSLITDGRIPSDRVHTPRKRSKIAYYLGASFGIAGVSIVALCSPFLLPALRRHCLPYVPATDSQLDNIAKALKKHVKPGGSFLDIGSGDGRICRLAANQGLFDQVHGVELNSLLVLFSKVMALKQGHFRTMKFYHRNLWRFPINRYDNICIFGVESMMEPLQKYLIETNTKPQTIFACRFPFKDMTSIDEIGEGIDTVWVYNSVGSKPSQMNSVSQPNESKSRYDLRHTPSNGQVSL